jgi:hypothetical protein
MSERTVKSSPRMATSPVPRYGSTNGAADWVDKGGELIKLSGADQAELMQKMQPIGDDIVSAKPELKPIWDMPKAAAARSL